MVLFRIFAASLLMVLPLLAQPGRGGATMTHVHVNSADPEAAIAFWTGALAVSGYSTGTMTGITMQGGVVLFSKAAPTGPSAGSAIEHIGIRVPDFAPLMARLAKTSYKGSQATPGGPLLIEGPDGVRIEVVEDSDLYTVVEFGHVHVVGPKAAEMPAWYTANLGARPGADDTSVRIGGALWFSKADAVVPTKGRAIDHISVETRDLAAFTKKMGEVGIKLEATDKPKVMAMTDPSGMLIEVSEAQ